MKSRFVGQHVGAAVAFFAGAACSSPVGLPTIADATQASDALAPDSFTVPDAHNCAPVTVEFTGAPSILFTNPDGTTFGSVNTSSGRQSEGCVLEGASVTAIYAGGSSGSLYTVLGVKPGETIDLRFPTSPPPVSTPVPSFIVNFTKLGKQHGANAEVYTYYAVGPCGRSRGADSPIYMEMESDCQSSSMQIQVLAYDVNNNLVAYVVKDNVDYSAGSTTMPTAYSAARTITANYTNVTPGTELTFFREAGVSASAGSVTSAAATQSLPVVGVAASPARAVTTAGRRTLEEPLDPVATNYGVDVAARFLPTITDCHLDVATGRVAMTTAAPGDTADLVDATYSYWHGAQQSQLVRWSIQGPPGQFVLPHLSTFQYLYPAPGDSIRYGGVTAVESPTWNGWDDVRVNGTAGPVSVRRTSSCGRQGI